MLVIGLTGGIASGKSTVVRRLRELGAPVVDTDAITHEIQAPGMPLLAVLAAEFGPEILKPDGSLDRPALGKIIFGDAARRKRLDEIMHPAVLGQMWGDVQRYRREGQLAVVVDVPLLIEIGEDKKVDQVWVVYVDRATQLERLIKRDQRSPEDAERRITSQMDLEAKRARAEVVIDNRGSQAETIAQVDLAWARALEGARSQSLA